VALRPQASAGAPPPEVKLTRTRLALALLALAVALLLSGCGGSAHKTAATAPAQPFGPSTQLPDLQHPGRNVNLFSLFNHDQGVARLLLLVSPT
jgi:hypothetical protein